MTRNSKQGKSRRRGAAPIPRGLNHPPSFSATKQFSGRARYLASDATTGITRGMLLNHLILNAASSTTNYRLLSGFRLKSVEMWCSTASLGTTTTVSIEWTSTSGPSAIVSDTSVGTAEPSHVASRPPPRSLAGFWCLTGNNESEVVCILRTSANTVVDITYDAVLQNGETPTAVTTTASGVAGTLYMTYLSGATTTTFPPISYASLT